MHSLITLVAAADDATTTTAAESASATEDNCQSVSIAKITTSSVIHTNRSSTDNKEMKEFHHLLRTLPGNNKLNGVM